jgi:hypothetical protein
MDVYRTGYLASSGSASINWFLGNKLIYRNFVYP